MSADLIPFAHEGAQLRTIVTDGEPWFLGPDACRMLDLRDTSSALKMVDEEDRRTFRRSDTPQFFEGIAPQVQFLTAVNESGMYALIFQSNKEQARKVRRWITGEVLPTIRKTGSYSTAPALTEDELIHRALTVSARRVAELTSKVAELEPKAEVADRLLDAEGDLEVADVAKVLNRAGIRTGRQRLFAQLESMRWIYRHRGDNRWRIYQSAVDAGYMLPLPQSHYHPKTGELVLDPPQVRVRPKGIQRLLKLLGGAEQLSLTGGAA